MLLSLILYGSRARGDHRLSSDVDLLGIVENGKIDAEVAIRGASFYAYPSEKILSDASCGNLFILHLLEEGKVLHDTVDFFESIRESFEYKHSYESEISTAHSVLNYLINKRAFFRRKAVRKRLIWAMRTILIARSAEARCPVFSSRDLAEFARYDALKMIIDKRNVVDPADLCSAAEYIADEFGSDEINANWPADTVLQIEMLQTMGGIAAASIDLVRPGFSGKRKRLFVSKKADLRTNPGNPYENII